MAEKSARYYIDDAGQFVTDLPDKNIIALVAPSAQCNFELPKLISALRLLGVKAVYDVSLGAEITVACYHEAISSGQAKLPLIAQPCPVIVKYIELHHAALMTPGTLWAARLHNLLCMLKSLHRCGTCLYFPVSGIKKESFRNSQMVQYNGHL